MSLRSKQFGGRLTSAWKSRYEESPHWKDGSFKNLVDTQTAMNWKQLPGIICKQIRGHKEGTPKSPLPITPLDVSRFLKASLEAKFIWYGHSVILMRLRNKTILIDPMMGNDASPIAPKKTKRFSEDTLKLIDDMPEIDLLLITHDHYDHLDYASMQRLKPKVKHSFVALGVKRHLVSWGFNEDSIIEFDWWDDRSFEDIHVTFTPTRHFSGRGLTSISKCLWGGWAFRTENESIWFSGDGGYGSHFTDIGEKLGPFDFAMMECGQYSEDWPELHMFPEESVQAALDAKAKVAMPVHWAGFNLSYQHSWYEPADEFIRAAKTKKLPFRTPRMGEIFTMRSETETWWKSV